MEENYNIIDLIPQREPFVMVDGIIKSNDKLTVTSFKIKESNIFCSNGYFHEPGLIENIAQTAAAAAGYERKQKGQDLLTGYIGGIKNLEIYEMPRVGENIETLLEVMHTVFNAKVVIGTVKKKDGTLCASCEMKIFLSEETAKV